MPITHNWSASLGFISALLFAIAFAQSASALAVQDEKVIEKPESSKADPISRVQILDIGRSDDSGDDTFSNYMIFSPNSNRILIGEKYPIIYDVEKNGFYEFSWRYLKEQADARAKTSGFPPKVHPKRLGVLDVEHISGCVGLTNDGFLVYTAQNLIERKFDGQI